jgi:hypothetical protein
MNARQKLFDEGKQIRRWDEDTYLDRSTSIILSCAQTAVCHRHTSTLSLNCVPRSPRWSALRRRQLTGWRQALV